jgi:hypothetical protein
LKSFSWVPLSPPASNTMTVLPVRQ